MTQPIPSRLFKSELIKEVPRAEFLGLPSCDNSEDTTQITAFIKQLVKAKPKQAKPLINPKKLYHMNIAVESWLRFREPPEKPVSLLIKYKDCKGDFAILIDSATVENRAPILLSGSVDIPYYGDLQYLQVHGSGFDASNRIVIEQVEVNRLDSQQQPQANSA